MKHHQGVARASAFAMIAIAALCFSAQAQAPPDIRIALVIGNAAYADAPLLNPTNDARAMGDALRGLGFTVLEIRDARKEQMLDAVTKVREALQGKQGVGLLYYAGHGLQLDWRNYMVPVNAAITKTSDIPEQALDVNVVIDAFKRAGNRMNILVLDACRDNPFGGTASGKGLAPLDAPPGTFLAYATAPGNVAEDGDAKSGNGLYTQFLLMELKKPVARIEDVFKRVRLQVRQKSQGRQIPWESTSLEDDFYFNTGTVAAAAKPDAQMKAQAFDQEKADWDKISQSKSADDLYAFLQKYPSGSISELAQAQLERLQKVTIVGVANQAGIMQTPGAARFRLGDVIENVVRDGYTGVEKQRTKSTVTRVGPDTVEFNNGALVTTPEGGAIRNRFVANWSPPRLDLPAGEYIIGKKWAFRSIQTSLGGDKIWEEGDVKILALEDVTVPAGTFKAYKLELNSFTQSGTRVRLIRWMEPDWGFAIKTLRQVYHRSGPPDLEIYEMVTRQRGKG